MKFFLFILGGMAAAALTANAALAQYMEWKPLTPAMVKAELEFRLTRDPSYATIWNAGYDFYRLHGRNQDVAMVIHLGYMAVRGDTPEEIKALRQAAIYWQKVHDYGITNVPVGIDENLRAQIPNGPMPYQSTLEMRRPKGGPVPMVKGGRAARTSRRTTYKGRPENPYPGPYYSGVYPP
jgi:hypothetical protein